MPPNTRISVVQGLKVKSVLCLWCKEPVSEKRKREGKAFCDDCENHIFGNEPVSDPSPFLKRTVTAKDFDEQNRKKEVELFVKMLKRNFRGLS